ncbi:MAG: bifunctional diguanylate cyclase/phosphodiesterase [Methylobacteriaceae bacterium]|nr:bifunctional diguanylate cyclase/phosphodiesterase [Methylobacteriaceae bacterium]
MTGGRSGPDSRESLLDALADRLATAASAVRLLAYLPAIIAICGLGLFGIIRIQGEIDEIVVGASRTELVSAAPRALFEADETRLAVLAYFRAPAAAARQEAENRFAALESRLRELESGAHRALLAASDEARRARASVAELIAEAGPLVRSLGPSADRDAIDRALEQTARSLQAFAAEAAAFRAARARADQARLQRLGHWQIAIMGVLLVSIASALLLSIGQKRRMALVHRNTQAMSERFEYLAKHDALTGLPNRRHGRDLVEGLIAAKRVEPVEIGLLCIDIDRFKQINDTLGHSAGDALLVAFAARLRQIAPASAGAHLVRLGGDEFLVAFALADGRDGLARRAREVAAHLAHTYELEGHHVAIGASLGAAAMEARLCDWATLLSQVDIALRHAKDSGRNQIAFYEKGMFEIEQRRHLLEQDLRFALERNQIEVHYQPIMRLQSDAVVGVEALVRWRHPDLGLIPPGDFIPIAEETGSIVEIGEWVLRTACHDATLLPAEVQVSVNLSAVQLLRDNLVEAVAAALAESGLSGARLELEVTESVMIRNEARVARFIGEIGKLGIGLALDDFGTGYSSLAYLRRFAFRRLKIDRTFVQDIERDRQARALARIVVDIGRALDMSITAEGVETQGQALLLAAEGCECAQGYLFARPLPLVALLEWMAARADGLRKVG